MDVQCEIEVAVTRQRMRPLMGPLTNEGLTKP
jgi:hypothetical protein